MSHQARKRFGQHFLTDHFVIDAIVDAIDPQPGQAMVEIGPGLGAMTTPLVARCQHLCVIELDRDLAARLRRRDELQVIEADVLSVDFAALAQSFAAPLRVVGNLPYNISSPILFHLLDSVAHVLDQHFMLQAEVVQRMIAEPATKAYGRLTCDAAVALCDRAPDRCSAAVVRAAAACRFGGGAHAAASTVRGGGPGVAE